MRFLLALAVVLTIQCIGCEHSENQTLPTNFGVQHLSVPTEGRQTYLAVGTLNETLSFLVICSEKDGPAGGVVSNGTTSFSNGNRFTFAQLRRPDGKIEHLPSDSFIFQFIDGDWSETPQMITLEEWTEFRQSKPNEYSIEKLSEFLGRQLNSREFAR